MKVLDRLFNKTRIARRIIASNGYNARRRMLMEDKIDYWQRARDSYAIGAKEKGACQLIINRYIKKLLYYINI